MQKWILGLLNGHKITYFLKIKVSLYSINLKLFDRKRVREKDPKNFLSEPDSLKTFWQLGCQVATLFAPLESGPLSALRLSKNTSL